MRKGKKIMKNLIINVENVEKLKKDLQKMRDENLKNGKRLKGNTVIVNGLNAIDLLEYYDYDYELMKKDEKAAGSVAKMVKGGCFRIFNDDIQNYINNYLGMNPNNIKCIYLDYKEYSYDDSFKLYLHKFG